MNGAQVKFFAEQLLDAMEREGYTVEQKREKMVAELKRQAGTAEMMLLGSIIQSPMNGFIFIKSIQIMLGNINEVLVEKEMQPVHILEMNLATVVTAQEYFNDGIDELYQKYTEGTLFE